MIEKVPGSHREKPDKKPEGSEGASDVKPEAAPEVTPEPQPEAQTSLPEFVRKLDRGKISYFVVDESADPATSIIEPGTGKRIREATEDERAEAVRMTGVKDPNGPRAYVDAPESEPRKQKRPEPGARNIVEPAKAPTFERSRFKKVENSANWTGRGEEGDRYVYQLPNGSMYKEGKSTKYFTLEEVKRLSKSDDATEAKDADPAEKLRQELNDAKRTLRERVQALKDKKVAGAAWVEVTLREIDNEKHLQGLGGIESRILEAEATGRIPTEPPPAESSPPASEAGPDTRTENEKYIDTVAEELANVSDTTNINRFYKKARSRMGTEAYRARLDAALRAIEAKRGRPLGITYGTPASPLDNLRPASGGSGAGGNGRGGGGRGNGNGTTLNRQPNAAPKDPLAIDRRRYTGMPLITTQEILADASHSQFFNERLQSIANNAGIDGKALLERYATGTPTPEDMKAITYATYEYSRSKFLADKLTEKIDDHVMEVFAHHHEGMHNINAQLKDPARRREILANMLRHKAMEDPVAFERFETLVDHVRYVGNTWKGRRADKKMTKLTGKIGAERGAFDDIFDFSSTEAYEATKADLEHRIHERAGAARQGVDWMQEKLNWLPGKMPKVQLPNWLFHGKKVNFDFVLPGSSRAAAVRMAEKARRASRGRFGRTGKMTDKLDARFEDMDSELTNLIGSDKMRELVAQEAVKNAPQRLGVEAGPTSYTEAQKSLDGSGERQVNAKIDAKIAAMTPATKARFDSDASYREQIYSDVKREMASETKRGAGFWSWFWNVVFGKNIDKAVSKREGRAVHVQ